jgi:hypothetical protein
MEEPITGTISHGGKAIPSTVAVLQHAQKSDLGVSAQLSLPDFDKCQHQHSQQGLSRIVSEKVKLPAA